MDKSAPPVTFGVFKPVGHTVIAFHNEDAMYEARRDLLAQGFGGPALVHYSAEEMLAFTNAELQVASPLADFGYEKDLLRLHHRLAEAGCTFLIVHTPGSAQQQKVSILVQRFRPASAQRYGRLLIEDLTEDAPGSLH